MDDEVIVRYSRNEITDRMIALYDEDMSKPQAVRALINVTDAILSLLCGGAGESDVCRVSIHNLGTFEVVRTKARKGRSIMTGEAVDIAAGRRIKFSPASSLKKFIKEIKD